MVQTISLSFPLLQVVLLLWPFVLWDVLHAVFGGESTPSHLSFIIAAIHADTTSVEKMDAQVEQPPYLA